MIFVSWFKWRVLHIFVAISNSLLFKSSESMKLTEADVKQMRTNRMFSGYPVPDQSRSHTFWSAVVNSFLEEHQFEDIAHVLARTWFSFVTKQVVPLWPFLTYGPMCSSKLGFNPPSLLGSTNPCPIAVHMEPCQAPRKDSVELVESPRVAEDWMGGFGIK